MESSAVLVVGMDARRFLPPVLGAATAVLGASEAWSRQDVTSSPGRLLLVALAVGVAVALCAARPGAALALVWATSVLQVVGGVDLMLVEAAFALVAFGCARWGSTATVWLSALSIPTAALIAVLGVGLTGLDPLARRAGLGPLVEERYSMGDTWQVTAAVVGTSLLAGPWLAGLALRHLARARDSRRSQVAAEDEAALARTERTQAEEIARLREEQTRLAHDVHDVVGHSLAVILAQAESAQYLPASGEDDVRRTLATIATSARASLQDVRQVLAQPTGASEPRVGGLDALVDGVRRSGVEVVSTETGTPHPLPPELEAVAHRTLQEMLTNALRHGLRTGPVVVSRRWPRPGTAAGLEIEVRNPAAPVDEAATPGAGTGLAGMRRRLDLVGGALEVRRDGTEFVALAVVPVRGR